MADEPLAIWLPGLVCDEAVWAGVHAHWAAPGPVITYPDERSIGAMAQRVLAAAAGRRVCLIGHSMGGRVALEAARQLGPSLCGLVLCSTGYQALPGDEAGQREREGRAQLVALAQGDGMRAMGERWVKGMLKPEHLGSPVEADVVAMIARHTPRTFENHVQALLNRPDATATLSGLSVPVLLLCGAQDSWSPPARHAAMGQLVPPGLAQLQIIEDAGHMLPMEQPLFVAHAIRAWMQRHTITR
ncbi:alpha/beta fold hydrolase [Hydrogenophaga palleronii]|uniref:alpha/beta fold hydrolase n=1 Tax=Hydrogenophaga palleronii TaxID=65655 RepID=UPI00082519C5|nr:alpha/beta hydrolase [Hydrogenophaga palleronii]